MDFDPAPLLRTPTWVISEASARVALRSVPLSAASIVMGGADITPSSSPPAVALRMAWWWWEVGTQWGEEAEMEGRGGCAAPNPAQFGAPRSRGGVLFLPGRE